MQIIVSLYYYGEVRAIPLLGVLYNFDQLAQVKELVDIVSI